MVRTLLCKVVFDHRIMVMTFVNESCLWQPHRLVRSVGQSILLRKTVYCQNFATQNRLQRQRSSLFLTAPFSSGCILCGSLVRTLLRKVATPPHLSLRFIVQNFASQSCLRQPHHGQSILLRKTVCDRPVFFGVHTLRFIKGLT